MRIAGAVLIGGLGLVACGGADDGDGAPPLASQPSVSSTTDVMAAATTGPPATALVTMPPPATGPYDGPAPAPVDEPCPMTADVQIDDSSFAEQSRLEPMIGQVLAYGQQHVDVFGQHGLVWHASDDASVLASFVGPLDVHRAALAELVEFPDELVVCQVALSGANSMTLITALTEEYGTRVVGAGFDGRAVNVSVRATDSDLAAELIQRFGDAVSLTVGALRYPIELAEDSCVDEAPGDPPPAGIELSIAPPTEPLSVAAAAQWGVENDDGWGLEATITNVGSEHVSSTSGTATGVLLDASGRVVSSNAPVAIAAIGFAVELDPGQSTRVPIVVVPSSCRVDLGYTVPPGDYHLVAAVQHAVDGQPALQMLTPPTPVTLVA